MLRRNVNFVIVSTVLESIHRTPLCEFSIFIILKNVIEATKVHYRHNHLH